MKRMKKIFEGILFMGILSGWLQGGVNVLKYNGTDSTLKDRLHWAENRVPDLDAESEYWVGYSIRKMMHKNCRTGTVYNDVVRRISLGELITGMENADESYVQGSVTDSDILISETDDNHPQVRKDVAILFFIPAGKKQLKETSTIRMTNMDQHVDLKNRPVLWLGKADQDESLDLLIPLYNKIKGNHEKKACMMAIAIHDKKDRVVSFLEMRLNAREPEEIREHASFWLGQQEDDRALEILKRTVNTDPSMEVREKSVFAVSQMDTKEAENYLIDLAYHAKYREIRKKAVFWLGQKASEKSIEALKHVVFNAEITEIQEHAVFALSQQDNADAVPELIRIMKTHPNPEVRKKAVFWLGETGDARGVDALVELIRN